MSVITIRPAPPPPVPEIISRREFYEGLYESGKITSEEATAALKTGTIPAAIGVILDGMTDTDARDKTERKLIGATEFNRHDPLVMVFAITQGMSEQDVDDFWRLCAAL